MLPMVHTPERDLWQKLHDSAATDDGRAIVGALMLMTVSLTNAVEHMEQEISTAISFKD